MICENCGSRKNSQVLETRERAGFVSRHRKCKNCGYEYLTHEIFVRKVRSKRKTNKQAHQKPSKGIQSASGA